MLGRIAGFIGAVWMFIGFVFLVHMLNNNDNGIYNIGTQAVYLQGESCTVNMTYDRTDTEIWNDFMACMKLHRKHKK